MDEDIPEAEGRLLAHLRVGTQPEPANKDEIISQAFEAMRAGSTLNVVALDHGYSPAELWRWIFAQDEHKSEYERVKIQRSQSLVEHALYEMQCAHTLQDAKLAEKRANLYLRLAAKLNPKEFSDKMHTVVGRQGVGAQRVSFTLNFQGGAQDKGALTVIAQPEDGEE